MPLTAKGESIKQNMEQEYGKEKGESVFYASKNAGKITGVDDETPGFIVGAPVSENFEYKQVGPAGMTLEELQQKNEQYWTQKAQRPLPQKP